MTLIKKILVVDDDLIYQTIIRKLLCSGYQLIMAENANSALQKLNEGYIPDLILADINLPDISGIDLIRKLNELDKIKDIPVIVISGIDDPKWELDLKNLGVKMVFIKPVDRKLLKKIIGEFLL
ncbi:MAG: response regulator [Bacteroidales bacterium]